MRTSTDRIVYCSAPVLAPADALLDIVRAAERNNARLGCSGMLFYAPTRYVQMIEGSGLGLATVYSRIAADPRHRILWMHQQEAVTQAIGVRLPMGYLSSQEAAQHDGFADIARLLMNDAGIEAEAMTRALTAAAAAKYPDVMRQVPV